MDRADFDMFVKLLPIPSVLSSFKHHAIINSDSSSWSCSGVKKQSSLAFCLESNTRTHIIPAPAARSSFASLAQIIICQNKISLFLSFWKFLELHFFPEFFRSIIQEFFNRFFCHYSRHINTINISKAKAIFYVLAK